MKIVAKLLLAVMLVSISCVKAVVQQPITDENGGGPYVSRDVVALYGFIKNYTNKPIVDLYFSDIQDPSHPPYTIINLHHSLNALYKIRFLEESSEELMKYSRCTLMDIMYSSYWLRGAINRLFVVYIKLADEPLMIFRNVRFSDELMNLNIYKKYGQICMQVTSPYHVPVSYNAEPAEAH